MHNSEGILVKHWAKQRGLIFCYEKQTGHLSAYSFILLVIHFLQQKGILPYLQQHSDVLPWSCVVETNPCGNVGADRYDCSFDEAWAPEPMKIALAIHDHAAVDKPYCNQLICSPSAVGAGLESVFGKTPGNTNGNGTVPGSSPALAATPGSSPASTSTDVSPAASSPATIPPAAAGAKSKKEDLSGSPYSEASKQKSSRGEQLGAGSLNYFYEWEQELSLKRKIPPGHPAGTPEQPLEVSIVYNAVQKAQERSNAHREDTGQPMNRARMGLEVEYQKFVQKRLLEQKHGARLSRFLAEQLLGFFEYILRRVFPGFLTQH